jgi:hypothetical protein
MKELDVKFGCAEQEKADAFQLDGDCICRRRELVAKILVDQEM